MTTSFYNKNTSTYLKNLFQKHDILNLIHKDNSLYIQNERNYITFKRVKKLGPDVLNFDQIENRNLQYNINQMETPQLQVASELCPLGTHKCYDEDANALFCGYQEGGFVPGEVPNCKSGSQYCTLDYKFTCPDGYSQANDTGECAKVGHQIVVKVVQRVYVQIMVVLGT